MINVDNLNDNVRESILQNLGLESEADFDEGVKRISLMNTFTAFDTFLKWHGIIGYTHMLIEAYENIKASSKS